MSLLATLIGRHVRQDEADPHWPDRDRLMMSGPSQTPAPEGATMVDGPPGLALGAAVGMAIAERLLGARFGRSLVDHRIWLAAQPQDLAAGTAQEALGVASAFMLGRLAVIAAMPQRDARLLARFAAAGWTVRAVPAGDEREADSALSAAARSQKPTLIVETGKPEAGAVPPLRPAQEDGAGEAGPVQSGRQGPTARRAWLKRLRRHAQREAFQQAFACHYPPGWHRAAYAEDTPAERPAAPEAAVLRALGRLSAALPGLAALPLKDMPAASTPHGAPHGAIFPHTLLSWDGLDQAAAACAAGMALHGGVLPILRCSPLQVEAALPAMRLTARTGARLLHVTVRADDAADAHYAPAGVSVLTPCDTAEALDCLVLALRQPANPSLLVLPPPTPPTPPPSAHRLCARGAYLMHDPADRQVTLFVAGAALPLADAVRHALAAEQVAAALVSIPSRSLFAAQDTTYQSSVLGNAPRVYFGNAARFAGLAGLEDMLVDPGRDTDPERIATRIGSRLRRVPARLEAW